jgi:ABC-type microcin C transport system duplicated ATPase subunit YejF
MKKTEFDYLLKISDLKMHFPVKAGIVLDHVIGWVKALDGIDLKSNGGRFWGWWENPEAENHLSKALRCSRRTMGGSSEGRTFIPGGPELKAYRTIQAVFHPFASLSPRLRVPKIISEPLEVSSTEQERAG